MSQRTACVLDRRRLLADHELGVREQQVGVELEGELRGVLGRIDRALGLSFPNCRLELSEPLFRQLNGEVAYRTGMGIHLGGDRGEEATAGEDALFDVPQEVLGEPAQPLEPVGGSRGRLDHLLGEEGARRLDRGELELLLGAEVGEEPALAHPDGVRQSADRKPADALDRGESCGFAQDRVTAALAVAAPPARAVGCLSANGRLAHRLTS